MESHIIANKLNIEKGGSNFSLDLIARSLAQRGHKITLVTTNITAENTLPSDCPYRVIHEPLNKSDLLRPKKVKSVFEKYESSTDLFHVFTPLLAPYAGYYRARGGEVPILGRLNQYRSLCSNVSMMDGKCQMNCSIYKRFSHSDQDIPEKIFRFPFYALQSQKYVSWMNNADLFYGVSPAVKSIFEGFGVNNNNITVIPNFYDPEFSNRRTEIQLSVPPTILYVGRLSYEKGVDTLLDAVSYASNDLRVNIIGEGPEEEALKQQTVDIGVSDQVTFRGFVSHEQLHEHYRRADIFVHPSRWPEPFSRTLLEALQTDCAVIGADTGGTAWALGDAGLLFPRNDFKKLGGLLDRCYDEPKIIRNKAEMGRKRLSNYHPKVVIKKLEQKKRELISLN